MFFSKFDNFYNESLFDSISKYTQVNSLFKWCQNNR